MRLPPIEPGNSTPTRRGSCDELQAGVAISCEDARVEYDTGVLVDPIDPWLHEPGIGGAITELARVLSAPPSMPERPREVATLVGPLLKATHAIETHRYHAPCAGSPRAAVDAIIAGRRPNRLTEERGFACETAAALRGGGVAPEPLYPRRRRAFGRRVTSEPVDACGSCASACTTSDEFGVAGPASP